MTSDNGFLIDLFGVSGFFFGVTSFDESFVFGGIFFLFIGVSELKMVSQVGIFTRGQIGVSTFLVKT